MIEVTDGNAMGNTVFVVALARRGINVDFLQKKLRLEGTKKLKELKDVVRFTFDCLVFWSVGIAIIALAATPVVGFGNIGTLYFLRQQWYCRFTYSSFLLRSCTKQS